MWTLVVLILYNTKTNGKRYEMQYIRTEGKAQKRAFYRIFYSNSKKEKLYDILYWIFSAKIKAFEAEIVYIKKVITLDRTLYFIREKKKVGRGMGGLEILEDTFGKQNWFIVPSIFVGYLQEHYSKKFLIWSKVDCLC